MAKSSSTSQIVIGIDPGRHTGIATYQDGKLIALDTISPLGLERAIEPADRVVFEDSRLISFMFTTVKSRPAALKMARDVGQIDAWCSLIVSICERLGIPAHGISPKNKGAKLNAEQFAKATGWVGKSNEHARDAAMVAFPYRRAAK